MDKALEWWEKLSAKDKWNLTVNYIKHPSNISEEAIKTLYELENLGTKQKIWKIHDRLYDLKCMKNIVGLSNEELLELRELEIAFDKQYSNLNPQIKL